VGESTRSCDRYTKRPASREFPRSTCQKLGKGGRGVSSGRQPPRAGGRGQKSLIFHNCGVRRADFVLRAPTCRHHARPLLTVRGASKRHQSAHLDTHLEKRDERRGSQRAGEGNLSHRFSSSERHEERSLFSPSITEARCGEESNLRPREPGAGTIRQSPCMYVCMYVCMVML
jgi:hypothetical protein